MNTPTWVQVVGALGQHGTLQDVDVTLVVLDPEAEGTRRGWVHVLASLFPSTTILVALYGRNRKALASASLGLPPNTRALVVPGSEDAALATAYRAALATWPDSDVVRLTALHHPVDAVKPVLEQLEEHDMVVLSAGAPSKASALIKEATGGRVEVGSYDFQGISHHVLPDLVALISSGDVDASFLVNSVKNGEVPHVVTNRWKLGEVLRIESRAERAVAPALAPTQTSQAAPPPQEAHAHVHDPLPEVPVELLEGDALAAAFLEAPPDFEDDVPEPADEGSTGTVPASPTPTDPAGTKALDDFIQGAF